MFGEVRTQIRLRSCLLESFPLLPHSLSITMRLEFSLHAIDLKNVAGAFKGTSDPFAVVTHMATAPGEKPSVLGKTEIVKNNLSPKWAKTFDFDYEMGVPMKLVVSIFDHVKKGDNKSMGSSVFDVGELLGARGCSKAKKLHNGGKLIAHVRKSQGSGTVRLQLQGLQFKNTEGLGLNIRKSDPFFEIARQSMRPARRRGIMCFVRKPSRII